jgi:hypothetical protein
MTRGRVSRVLAWALCRRFQHRSRRGPSALGEFWLASDAITNSDRDRPGTRAFAKVRAEVPPEEIDEFFVVGCTVGAYIVFPYGKRIDDKTRWSINQSRGHVRADRFDLTL